MADEKKIIIDEDWKSQVEAEKRTAAAKSDTAKADAAPAEQQGRASRHGAPIPPATFPFLLSTLATPALIALGQMPNPLTGQMELHPEQARHFIDMLAMVQEKTAGNLTSEEAIMLDELLHELRLIFVTGQNSDERASVEQPSPGDEIV